MRAKRNRLMMLALVLSISPGLAQAATDEQKSADELRHLKFLEWEAGDWDATIVLSDPAGGEPQQFWGEQTDREGACGLWLITDLRMVAGKDGAEPPPYEGHGVLGYDPDKKKLVGIWIDSSTDWLATAEGSLDAAGKTLTLDVASRDPASGGPMTRQFVTTRLAADHRRLEIFVPLPDGGRLGVATIDYRRRTTERTD